MSTGSTAELAATLAQLATELAAQQRRTEADESKQRTRALPERILLTVEEAADQLRIGRTKAYALVKSGEIESVQIGRLRRVPKDAISDYIEQLAPSSSAA